MGNKTSTNFYKDKPIFGLDIGFNTVKVMQLYKHKNKYRVLGYGINQFEPDAIENGIIKKHELVAEAILDLFKNKIEGDISTRRVAFSIPAARTFSRVLTLPKIDEKDFHEAVSTEAEQYIPVPMSDLYLDYSITRKTDKNTDVLAVAVPKKLIDSYDMLADLLGLEVMVMESTTSATGRLFNYTDRHNVPSILVDFGSISSDISLYDESLIVTGTIPGGGDDITNAIAKKLGVTHKEAHVIKTKYGINVSKKQSEILEALEPMLSKIVKELKRILRYHEERSDNQSSKIEQIITLGGGSNVPGLSEYLIDQLRLPVRSCDPWDKIEFHHVKPPTNIERAVYITVAGLAMIDSKEIF